MCWHDRWSHIDTKEERAGRPRERRAKDDREKEMGKISTQRKVLHAQ